ncbi:hypothetical protein MCAP1_001794 [Malassezia caprae]|uniref:U6 snRNA-associated Sm-like protein LSm1 n=1 Tax=Malassezia caprae TaxID=1381934 RepID=A0AAF0E6B0_9BASI|nr:hypothetical protein MCAP1_001794 [Malassezia caprae]
MEAQEILANIAFTTSGALVDLVDSAYGDVPKGLYIVRGENVVLMGEIDLDKEDEIPQTVASSIPSSAIPQLLEALAAENEYKDKWEQRRTAVLRRERGFSGEGVEGDSY